MRDKSLQSVFEKATKKPFLQSFTEFVGDMNWFEKAMAKRGKEIRKQNQGKTHKWVRYSQEQKE